MSMQLHTPGYVIIYVSEMERSVSFYRDMLGLPMKFTSPGWTEFDTGTTTVALHRARNEKSSAEVQRSVPGIAQLGFIIDDLQAAYEALKAQDVYFSLPPQKQPSGITLAVLHDPDGLGISLQQR